MPDIYNTPLAVPDILEGAGSFVAGISGAVSDDLTQLENRLAPLREAQNWGGGPDAAAKFYDEHRIAWRSAADELFVFVMGSITTVLNTNYLNYMDAEDANRKTWKA